MGALASVLFRWFPLFHKPQAQAPGSRGFFQFSPSLTLSFLGRVGQL